MEEINWPEGFKDSIATTTIMVFDWRDRLKILLGAKVQLETHTYTENLIGKQMNGRNRLLVWLREPRLRDGGVVAAESQEIRKENKQTFEEWFVELKAIAIRDYGFTSANFHAKAWRVYYEDGLSPHDAMREDLSEG